MSENNLEVMELIDELYTMVSEAWGVPLGNDKCIIERELLLDKLNEIRTLMPTELAEAKKVVSTTEMFYSNAKREAESVRKAAEEKANEMLKEQEIVKRANAYANQVVGDAERKSSELRRVASEYVDDILRRTEITVADSLKALNNARDSFKSLAGVEEKEEAKAE